MTEWSGEYGSATIMDKWLNDWFWYCRSRRASGNQRHGGLGLEKKGWDE